MPIFNQSDMQYKDYKWTAYPSDDPKVTGKPDSTFFNRHEGYEVLYLINHIEIVSTKVDGAKAEQMIRSHLPSDIRSQIEVKDWIESNWNNY